MTLHRKITRFQIVTDKLEDHEYVRSAVKVFEKEKKKEEEKENIRHLVSQLIYQRGVPLFRITLVNDTQSLRRGYLPVENGLTRRRA